MLINIRINKHSHLQQERTMHFKSFDQRNPQVPRLFEGWRQYMFITRSAILWGSVACPLLARTLGRMDGGCGTAAPDIGFGGWLWKGCMDIIKQHHKLKDNQIIKTSSTFWVSNQIIKTYEANHCAFRDINQIINKRGKKKKKDGEKLFKLLVKKY